MIPKVIHWCWFGRGKVPSLAKKCIKSWKKILPDYEIKLWNEDNFDIESNAYVSEAYHARKFAFVTDYVRLYALYHEGGIYMDSDVEVLKRIDRFLEFPAFTGYEDQKPESCITGIMGSERGGAWVKALLDEYEDRHFILPDGRMNTTTNVQYTAALMKSKGMRLDCTEEHVSGFISLFPREYFCPKAWNTGKFTFTDDTYTIHHFSGSWWDRRSWWIRWADNHYGPRVAYYVGYFWRPPRVVVAGLWAALKRRLNFNP